MKTFSVVANFGKMLSFSFHYFIFLVLTFSRT
jgi:hypothetical protein